MTATAHRRLAALAAVLAVALAGCASLPTEGPVTRGDVGDVDRTDPIYLLIDGPAVDATPEQVVRGFVTAQAAGAGERYETARLFLTEDAAESWDPRTGITVYSGDLAFDAPQVPVDPSGPVEPAVPTDPDAPPVPDEPPVDLTTATRLQLTAHARVAASVDGAGRLTEGDPEAVQDLQVTLDRDVQGQWRISSVADGLLVSQPNFLSAYESTSIYFATADLTHLVPEVRWFPAANHASYAVSSLLAGPSGWLRDVVVSGAPPATSLAVDGVTRTADGRATVDLGQGVLAADDADRALLVAQLEATLRPLGVSGVDLLVDGVPLAHPDVPTLERDPAPGGPPVAVREADATLVRLEGRDLVPLEGYAPLDGLDVTGLAASAAGDLVVARVGSATLVRLVPGGAPVPLVDGVGVVVPSIDRTGRVWTADRTRPGALTVVVPGEGPVVLEAPWLEDAEVVALRVARDGARVAVVVRTGDVARILVAGVVRAADGSPTSLTTPVTGGASLTTVADVAWVDESTLVVLGAQPGAGHLTAVLVPVGGQSELMSTVDEAVSVTSGRGRRAVYVETARGEVFGRGATGTNWSAVVSGVRRLAYPG